MGASFIIGKTLVSSDELLEKIALGLVTRFLREGIVNRTTRLEFSTGTVTADEVIPAHGEEIRVAGRPDYTPIGIARPMSIQILTTYTGSVPRDFWGADPDLLTVSAIKGIHTFDAAPRAINQIKEKIGDKEYIEPMALTDGCPIVYYTPSLDIGTLLCSFEMITKSFDKKIFKRMSELFSKASGLPIFAPANAYLLAGSFLLEIFSDIGKALLESKPFLKANLPLHFMTPDFSVAIARQVALYNDRDRNEFIDYEPGVIEVGSGIERAVLLNKTTKKEYSGDAPYMIFSLDGRLRVELNEFTPKIASAAMIETFYGPGDTGGEVVKALGSAMELFNDYTYREKALALIKQMESLVSGSVDYQRAEKLLNAYKGNIRSSLFKLP